MNSSVQEQRAVDVERFGDRGLGVLLRPGLDLVIGARRADLARVLGEPERLVRGARESGYSLPIR